MLKRLDLTGRVPPEVPTSGSWSRSVWTELLPANAQADAAPSDVVSDLLAQVRAGGDAAVAELTKRFDSVEITQPLISAEELRAASKRIDPRLKSALELAHRRIVDFHSYELDEAETVATDGITINSVNQSVDRAGIYVPGGLAAYPSTVLMTVLPARVAGVEEVVLCSPPDESARLSDAVLAAAHLCGVDEVYSIGGVQAIAAMAYGTETIAAVDVIAGPGNAWVAAAQRQVVGEVGVAAAFAGPSEIAIIADSSCAETSAAIDLVLQAEHGPGGRAWLITWEEDFADKVAAAVSEIAQMSPRRAETIATLSSDGYVCLVDDASQAVAVANALAPEHLQIMAQRADELAESVRHAGAVFVGPWTPASLGDYIAGPSHVLPTNGTARFAGALGVADFQKKMHIVEATQDGLKHLSDAVISLAEAEGLWAHAASVAMREQWASQGLGAR